MADKTVLGRFVWHDLTVPDAAKAHQFYNNVIGWTTVPSGDATGHNMFATAAGPLGAAAASTDTPPHWLPFLGTVDIDSTVQQATLLGAEVVKGIESLPDAGRFAALIDPQGAAFGVYQSSTPHARERPAKRGEFSWHELLTSDYKAAFDFYSRVFGWDNLGEFDMGPMGIYYLFGRNGTQLGGMFNKPAEMPGGPSWLGYIRVKDVHKAIKKATVGGATLVNGPMEVPGGDWIAQFVDPQGATFAVHTLAVDLSSRTPAADAPTQTTLDLGPSDAAPVRPSKADAAPKKKVRATKPVVAKAARAKRKPGTRKAAQKKAVKQPTAKQVAAKSGRKKKLAKKSAARKVVRKTVRKAAKKSSRKAHRGK